MSASAGALPRRQGFTLVELLVTIAVIGVLVGLIVAVTGGVRDRVEKVRCMSNLRNLHIGLSSYVQDKGHWPQCPTGAKDEAFNAFWVAALDPYAIPEETWRCPTLTRHLREGQASDRERGMRIHYLPTQFDAHPYAPFRWAKQPWLVEIGDSHGGGALIIFPDGSIKGFSQVFEEQTGHKWPPQ